MSLPPIRTTRQDSIPLLYGVCPGGGYTPVVMRSSNPRPHRTAVLSRDTSPEAERRQVALWRGMTEMEKARLVSSASRAVQLLSLAGIRRRHPQASAEECMLRLARLKLGSKLFALAHPESATRLRF